MELGFLVVVPTLLVLIVAIISRREIEPLILGCVLGSILIGGWGFMSTFISAGYEAMVDPGFTMVAIASFGFAGLIELMNSTGGAEKFAERSAILIKGEKSAGLVTWLICWALFVDDYMHAMVVSATMKKVVDRFNMPRKVLTYIANATAAAMAVVVPSTVWSSFFMGIFENDYLSVLGLNGYSLYTSSIPFFIYPFVTIIMSLLVAIKVVPALKAMRTDDGAEEDNVDAVEKYGFEPKAIYFVLPMLVVVAVAIAMGGDVILGLYAGIVVAFGMYAIRRVASWEQLRTAFLRGSMSILPVVIMLFFTFTLVQINAQLQFTEYVVELAKPIMNANLLPVVIFVISSSICFCSGSYWGTSALITPIASALAISSGANVFLTLGAIVSGAVFGSSACLFGDTNNLSAVGAGIKPINHTMAQLPLCFINWGISVIAFLALGFAL